MDSLNVPLPKVEVDDNGNIVYQNGSQEELPELIDLYTPSSNNETPSIEQLVAIEDDESIGVIDDLYDYFDEMFDSFVQTIGNIVKKRDADYTSVLERIDKLIEILLKDDIKFYNQVDIDNMKSVIASQAQVITFFIKELPQEIRAGIMNKLKNESHWNKMQESMQSVNSKEKEIESVILGNKNE